MCYCFSVCLSLSLYLGFFSVNLPMHCPRISPLGALFNNAILLCFTNLLVHPNFKTTFRSSVCFWADVYTQGGMFWRKLWCLGGRQQNTCKVARGTCQPSFLLPWETSHMPKVSAWCVDYAYGSVKAGSLHLINLKRLTGNGGWFNPLLLVGENGHLGKVSGYGLTGY